MPCAPRKLAELDKATAEVVSFSVDALFPTEDNCRLALRIEASLADESAPRFELSAVIAQGRRGRGEKLWSTRCKTLSGCLRSFARRFPFIPLSPTRFHVTGRGGTVSQVELRRLLLEGIAEAYGQAQPVALPAEVPPASGSEAVDWPARLRSGPGGLKDWNRLTAAERKAVDLAGANLAGCNLAKVKLRAVSAKGASFAGANLAGADLAEMKISRADFEGADLTGANLKRIEAPDARFPRARLSEAEARGAMLFGVLFAGADLTGAVLSDANIQKADFTGATLDRVNLDKASFDLGTVWPAGFVIPAEVLLVGRGTDPRLSGKGKHAVATDVNGLIARMNALIDPKRMARSLDMLKKGKNQLFAEVEVDHVRGIVRSQRELELVYSCVLTADGSYTCCTPDLSLCMGLRGEPCKHILVLLIGLARAGRLDPAAVDPWLVAAKGKNHKWNKTLKNYVSDTLLRYQGAQAGEVDWRPTETIPEDFYAF